jgi:hypothetical protein
MMDKVVVGNVYINKKNGLPYEVHFIGKYTEMPMLMEPMVGYVALYETDERNFVRPYRLFLEKFEEMEV